MSNVLSGHTTITTLKPYVRYQNHEYYAYVLLKIISIYCLTLHKWGPSWILPRRQCSNIFFDHTTICHAGIPQNPLVDTQIMNHYILLKLYQLIV